MPDYRDSVIEALADDEAVARDVAWTCAKDALSYQWVANALIHDNYALRRDLALWMDAYDRECYETRRLRVLLLKQP